MANKSVTLSITTSSATHTLPTDNDSVVALKNIGANAIWISHETGTAAAVEGDECEPILAGETVYINWRPTIVAIAETGTTKLVATSSLGRV